jgi:serine/threonine protein kinase
MGQAHGDLKPENIFVAGERVVLLDPGFYGDIRLADGSRGSITVTTPAYYPLRRPDDMMAFGLILVEIVTGVNPLRTPSEVRPGLISAGMAKRLNRLHLANNYFFDPICRLSRRTELGEKLAQSHFAESSPRRLA